MPAEITTREAVNRALAAMEIAESCPEPQIRASFTNLAESWLAHAEALGGGVDDRPDVREAPPGP